MKTYLLTAIAITIVLAMGPIAWADGIETTSTDLPPDGEYISPDEYHSYSAAGIILDDPSHRPTLEGVEREPIGDDELETFDSVFTAIEIGLGLGPIELTGPVQVIVRGKRLSDTGTFDTEMVSMSLTGSTAAGPIMVREDPTRPSSGQTTIDDLGGGLYHIDSFFDVFTELSVDGGNTWVPSDTSTRMILVPDPPQGIETTSTDLPPDGEYISPDEYHSYSAAGIILDDPSHRPILEGVEREPIGDDELETFDSVFTAIEIGLGLGPIQLTGPVQVIVRGKRLSATGTFDTEMISMSLTGSTPAGPIMVREDPTRPTLGQTTISDLGGGLYHIDSFFDVFTELSVDGGNTWVPSDTSTRMILAPDPPKPGDADGDGDVDLDDFVILKTEFGLAPPPALRADFDNDGDVDLDDFIILKNNFGTAGPAATSTSTTS